MADFDPKPPPTLSFTCHTSSYPAINPLDRHNTHLSMSGRTVLITGASRSIGAAIARSFAQAGASNIVIISRSRSALDVVAQELRSEYKDLKVHVHTLDLAKATALDCQTLIKSVIDAVETNFIDTLVLNACHIHEKSHITGSDFLFDDFWTCYETNVRGNLHLIRAFLHQASCPSDATIIDITSILGYVAGYPWAVSGYASSKAALIKILECLHVERPALRIFHVHPGLIKTEMLSKAGIPTDLEEQYYDDVDLPANFCVWLASSRADFLNGKTIESRWDVEEMEQMKEKILSDSRIFRISLQSRGYVPNM